ncbi:SDR family NAD(P)-dependent oxidoreductase [Rhodohalobacter sp. SW132]|uniref:SDR family NAD(P)-dependent oxidoreductase n=1 Tax=Rhodohalobacter sp. SW132 TaxID=2293433 RepID=UPI0011C06A89|nr:SDR family oxidoreductase [Rhodohalobacter sp. SW132]
MSFTDKAIIITGGAKGIGEGCARIFHRDNGNVAIFDVDEKAGTGLARDLGDRCRFYRCDVSSEKQVQQAVSDVIKDYGRVDVLVNNAGILKYSGVTDTSEEEWEHVMEVNVKGAFLCAKHTIPYMQKQGKGVVVNMSSVQAFVAQKNVAAYIASKSALIGLTRSIAVDYAPEIRSVAICPGGVDTPMNREAFSQSADPDKVRQETIDIHLVERMANQREIGELVAFVSGEKGAFITGQPIRIDGGIGIKLSGSI